MFTSYDEALGALKASQTKDPQRVAAISASLRSTPQIIRIISFFFMIPSFAITLTVIGAIVGIPAFIACCIFVSKSNTALRNIEKAKLDWIS